MICMVCVFAREYEIIDPVAGMQPPNPDKGGTAVEIDRGRLKDHRPQQIPWLTGEVSCVALNAH
jgi:hypothetical protein